MKSRQIWEQHRVVVVGVFFWGGGTGVVVRISTCDRMNCFLFFFSGAGEAD